MTNQVVDSKLFKEMLQSGCNNLLNRFKEVDALNVFPVPDGDTGTNMSLTFSSGVKDANAVTTDCVGDIAKALSKGLLMGARGNSGVILSQIFRGFSQAVEGLETLTPLEMAQAFQRGSEVAYKAVMRPVEGTILTVIRESSFMAVKHVEENPEINLETYFQFFLDEAKKSLEYTPELLAVLKEVGVVDSGGAGLVVVLEGFLSAIQGTIIPLSENNTTEVGSVQSQIESDEFGYCTEFIVRLSENGFLKFNEAKFRKDLEKLGNSLVVVQDEDLVKVHVHTLKPGNALNMAQRFGEFVKLKIENMQEQHEHLMMVDPKNETTNTQPEVIKEYGIIAVCSGEGLTHYFKELRADVVINGGQTMNPSTEDFVAAIGKVPAKNVFILPNNSNIILAAQQAQDIVEDKNIIVLPTKTIPQGLSACMMFNPDADVQTNVTDMNEGIDAIKTGQITTAIKDTSFEGIDIKEGHYIGIYEKNIVASNDDLLKTAQQLLDRLVDEDSELITIIVGADAPEQMAVQLETYLVATYDVEVEILKGQQPVYHFIFGVE